MRNSTSWIRNQTWLLWLFWQLCRSSECAKQPVYTFLRVLHWSAFHSKSSQNNAHDSDNALTVFIHTVLDYSFRSRTVWSQDPRLILPVLCLQQLITVFFPGYLPSGASLGVSNREKLSALEELLKEGRMGEVAQYLIQRGNWLWDTHTHTNTTDSLARLNNAISLLAQHPITPTTLDNNTT